MFTGLIEAIGTVKTVSDIPEGKRFVISTPFARELTLGESVAVNGVCLTVISFDEEIFSADVIPESLACTTLGQLAGGTRVNLERALQVGARLGGHVVQGHVDDVGTVMSIEDNKKGWVLSIEAPTPLLRYIAHKGSITINGVSLTVSLLDDSIFSASLVPHTLQETTLGDLAVGDKVNLEVDLIARYLERFERP